MIGYSMNSLRPLPSPGGLGNLQQQQLSRLVEKFRENLAFQAFTAS